MPHSRARRRARERARIEEIKRRDAELGEDAGYYRGEDCTCGVRLFCWLVPRDGSTPTRLHWPFMMSARMHRTHLPVVAHTGEDAIKALAHKPTHHDAHIELASGEFEHCMAHANML